MSDHLVLMTVSHMSVVMGEMEAKWNEKNNEAAVTLKINHEHTTTAQYVLLQCAHTPDMYTHEMIYTVPVSNALL